jgi:Tfp pilus assembly protein PilF
MEDTDTRELALRYFCEAYHHQMEGEFDEAIRLYTKSVKLYPTAEAYTFRGWTYSFKGDLDKAIEDCHRAIETDPDFGNPYNDIGAYLIEQGKLDEAIPWLERAVVAPRYEARCYPHMNLGRVYERKLDWEKAMECYRNALQENADYTLARKALGQLIAKLN